MHEHDAVAACIERIVAGARIPGRAARDDLRRELWSHFEEAGASPEAVRTAMRRFGSDTMIVEAFRRVYRRDYLWLYLAKIAASIVASVAAALLIQVLVNLRTIVQAGLRQLAPGISHAAVLSVGVVFAAVAAREVGRQPFRRARAVAAIAAAYAAVCVLVQLVFANGAGAFVMATVLVVLGSLSWNLESRSGALLLTFGMFTAAEYGIHLAQNIAFGPTRAVLASAVLLAVWASTLAIVTRVDRAFVSLFEPSKI